MAKNIRDWSGTWQSEIALDGVDVRTVANINAVGGIPVLFRIDVPDAATGDISVTMTEKVRVIDVWAVKTGALGGAANTVQVKSTGNAITDALDLNVADQTIARATTINDANHEIAAGGVLRVSRVKAGGNAACTVYVMAVKVA